MRQVRASLDEGDIAKLEQAAEQGGRSLSEEIRIRLERSLQRNAIDPYTSDLMKAVKDLAALVKQQTGRAWHTHSAAIAVLKDALDARLERLTGRGEAVFAPEELPLERIVASADQRRWGAGLEAIDWREAQLLRRSGKSEKQRKLDARREILRRTEAMLAHTERLVRDAKTDTEKAELEKQRAHVEAQIPEARAAVKAALKELQEEEENDDGE
jgi:TraY domain